MKPSFITFADSYALIWEQKAKCIFGVTRFGN